jgi:hypothetical protein
MFRKLMIGAAAVVALGFAAESASAAPPIVVQPSIGGTYQPFPGPFPGPNHPDRRHDHDYVVYVQHRGHWDRYGRYETLREAERVERWLERQGRRAKIEIVESRRW